MSNGLVALGVQFPWVLSQSFSMREAIPVDHGYRFLLYALDRIFSEHFDPSVRHLGLRVLKITPQSPQANAVCEWLLGTLRWECLDYVIPLTEEHLRHLLDE